MEQEVKVTILGTAQDAGIPQAGCSCERCLNAHNHLNLRKYPVSIGIEGIDGSKHLIEITKNLSEQLKIWSEDEKRDEVYLPDTVTITHLHLGHIEGIGQFGKPVMNLENLPVYLSSENKLILEGRNDIQLMIKEENIKLISQRYNKEFQPKNDCGFTLELIPIPHRSELGNTAAIRIKGTRKTLLFLPDQDSWDETLDSFSMNNIRELLIFWGVDIAWIDGTFWNLEELPGRELSEIPHPTIEESLHLLGRKHTGDPEISFIHLNHSNPANDIDSEERKMIKSYDWGLCKRNDIVLL